MSCSLIVFLLQVVVFVLDFPLQPFSEISGRLDGTFGSNDGLFSCLQLLLQLFQFTLGLGRQQRVDNVTAHGTGVPLMQCLMGLVDERVPVLLALNGGTGLLFQFAFALDACLFLLESRLLLSQFFFEFFQLVLGLNIVVVPVLVSVEFLLGIKQVVLADHDLLDVHAVIFVL